MKNCPYCKIEVGGNLKKCPLCQSKLVGEEDRPYFPRQTTLKIQSFFYKLQLFIVWAVIISSVGLDFMFHFNIHGFTSQTFHWSLLVAMWLFVFEFGIMRLFKKGLSSSRILTIFVFIVVVLGTITAYYVGQVWIMLEWVVPIAIIGTMIANFILAMLDKNGNAMVYLLSNFLVGILPYVVFYFREKQSPFWWIICLIVSLILFVGAIIFKGREVVGEIQRRLNV
ncbi:MAG: hypothetical protein K6F66_01860 [Pseudobutyrivibrio sp.]|nr:hypothetical protein [Pseudobutyrivibrio sp.]